MLEQEVQEGGLDNGNSGRQIGDGCIFASMSFCQTLARSNCKSKLSLT